MTVETAASDATGMVERDTVAACPPVSVVVPAFNAADTLGETLESLQAQSHRHWEALVVDDGSTDNTLVVAGNAAGGDPRIRVLSIGHRGESGARNAGIAEARFEWLLFLDADDWLTRDALEALTDEIARDPGLDLVYGSWTYVTPDGEEIAARYPGTTPEHLFSTSARTFPFAVHACLVRRSRVLEVGGFDPTFVTCPDWDLWQRLGRAGVRCRLTDKCVARYRVRPGSASFNVPQVLQDGLRVIRTGFGEDPRVRFPRPELAHGLERAGLPSALWCFTAAVAGVALSAGKRPIDLVEPLRSEREPGLDPFAFGRCLVAGGMLPFYRVSAWEEVWRRDSSKLDEFLDAVEESAQAPGFARAVHRVLERLTLSGSKPSWPRTLGRTHAEVVDVGAAIQNIHCSSDVETLLCRIELKSTDLGTLELPVFDGFVPAGVVADAAAAEFGWDVLKRFFATSLFPELRLERTAEGVVVWRGDVRFPKVIGASEADPPSAEALHRAVGWGLFLQELWGRPEWPTRLFYEKGPTPLDDAPTVRFDGPVVPIEISDDLPDIETRASWLDLAVTVAGAAAGKVRVRAEAGRVSAGALRRAITAELGFELCAVAVREALVGHPPEQEVALRSRLQNARRRSAAVPLHLPRGVVGTSPLLEQGARRPGSIVVLGRRRGGLGTNTCRRASLPASAATELTVCARANGEPVTVLGPNDVAPGSVIYAPDLLWTQAESEVDPHDPAITSSRTQPRAGGDRHRFEALFAAGPDPWRYTSPYEQVKYEQTLALLPQERIGTALELACAEGHFTNQLAVHVGRLVACDISRLALERAAARCAERSNVEFRRLDFLRDPLPCPVDLIVCSEALYFAGDRRTLAAIVRAFSGALRDGGHLLMAHAHALVDDPSATGFDWNVPFGANTIGETAAAGGSFQLVREIRTALYRVQLFRKSSATGNDHGRSASVEHARHGALPPRVEKHVRWDGGQPSAVASTAVVTSQLPILAYHRVCASASGRNAAFSVTPSDFEEQLHYLSDAGFRSISLEEWRLAAASRSPIGGRAVIVTFDDGYDDFAEHAWPLLQKYEFSASLFVVTDLVGKRNRWDSAIADDVPLLDWDELRRLRAEGVDIGSHSLAHRPLVGRRPLEVVREATESRAKIADELGATILAFAYPFGIFDRAVQHVVGACGYQFGLTMAGRRAREKDAMLALPRLAVTGDTTLSRFIRRLSV